jgi:hypothetical protein
MKKIYPFFFFTVLLVACSKDFLKSYDRRIIGSWYIADIYRFGIGGRFDEPAFRSGTFLFKKDGTLTYTDAGGNVYEGSWNIQKRNVNNETIRTFQVTAVDFNNQQVRSEFYDRINFRSTNHFAASVNTNYGSLVTHFRR